MYSFTFFRRLEELEDYDIDGASVPGKSPTVHIHHDQIINTSYCEKIILVNFKGNCCNKL